MTTRVALAVPSPLVPPLPLAERPAAYIVADPEAGAVQLKLKLTLPAPSTALRTVCTISPLINLVPWPVIDARAPEVAETSRAPEFRCPPLIVSVYVLVDPWATLAGPVRATVVTAPPL